MTRGWVVEGAKTPNFTPNFFKFRNRLLISRMHSSFHRLKTHHLML
jgi:hypothetical protein